MAEQVQALVQRFEQVNAEVIALVEGCDDQQWQTEVPEEQRTVAVVAHHVAGAYPAVAGWVTSLAHGRAVETTMEQIDQINEAHKAKYAHVRREEVRDLLKRNGATAIEAITALDEQQLDSGAMMGPAGREVTARQLIKSVLIGHAAAHLATMRRAIEQ